MTKVTQYLHCDKGDVAYDGDEQGLTDDQITSVIGAVYEVEFTIDADTGTIIEVKSGRQTFNSNTGGALKAQDARNLAATEKVGWNPMGCDTPDALADEVLALRQEIELLKEEEK